MDVHQDRASATPAEHRSRPHPTRCPPCTLQRGRRRVGISLDSDRAANDRHLSAPSSLSHREATTTITPLHTPPFRHPAAHTHAIDAKNDHVTAHYAWIAPGPSPGIEQPPTSRCSRWTGTDPRNRQPPLSRPTPSNRVRQHPSNRLRRPRPQPGHGPPPLLTALPATPQSRCGLRLTHQPPLHAKHAQRAQSRPGGTKTATPRTATGRNGNSSRAAKPPWSSSPPGRQHPAGSFRAGRGWPPPAPQPNPGRTRPTFRRKSAVGFGGTLRPPARVGPKGGRWEKHPRRRIVDGLLHRRHRRPQRFSCRTARPPAHHRCRRPWSTCCRTGSGTSRPARRPVIRRCRS